MIVERDTFKDRPVIRIKRDENDRYGVTMGLTKSKLVLEAIEEIKKFVEDNDKPEVIDEKDVVNAQ